LLFFFRAIASCTQRLCICIRTRVFFFLYQKSGTERSEPRPFFGTKINPRALRGFLADTQRPGHERVARIYTDATILFGGMRGGGEERLALIAEANSQSCFFLLSISRFT
jgi:hypothetical protein